MEFLRNLFGKKAAAPLSNQLKRIGGDALMRVCLEIFLRLQLTHIAGVNEIPDLTKMLMKDKNYSDDLANGVATVTFNAYEASGDNQKKYLDLCVAAFQKMM